MSQPRVALVSIISAVALLASACGGDGNGTASPTPEVSPTPEASTTTEPTTTATAEPATAATETASPATPEADADDLSPERLAVMVLPATEIGAAVDGFEVDPDSGQESAGDVADVTFAPDDVAEDWTGRGYLRGYELSYSPSDFFDRLEAGEGVNDVSSWVAAWSDDQAASAGLAAAVQDISDAVGIEIDSVTVTSFEAYDGPDLGDETIAFQASAELAGFEFQSGITRVLFRVGRLTAGAWLVRFGEPMASDRADVERMAQALEERIELVLRGELDEQPVPIPVESVTDGLPDGVPDLALLALNLEDPPAGIIVENEGYDPDPSGLAEYERDFDALGQTIGSTELLEFEHTVYAFRNAGVASAFMEFMGDFLTGPSGVEAFASGEFPVELSEIEGEPIAMGDEGLVIRAAGSSPIGEIEFAFFLARVDGLMSILIASGQVDQFSAADIEPLAEIAAERLRQ